jgi:hypothetical protein
MITITTTTIIRDMTTPAIITATQNPPSRDCMAMIPRRLAHGGKAGRAA